MRPTPGPLLDCVRYRQTICLLSQIYFCPFMRVTEAQATLTTQGQMASSKQYHPSDVGGMTI